MIELSCFAWKRKIRSSLRRGRGALTKAAQGFQPTALGMCLMPVYSVFKVRCALRLRESRISVSLAVRFVLSPFNGHFFALCQVSRKIYFCFFANQCDCVMHALPGHAMLRGIGALAFPLNETFPKDQTLAVRQRFAEAVFQVCRKHFGVDALLRIQQPCGLVHIPVVADGVKAQERPGVLLFCVLPAHLLFLSEQQTHHLKADLRFFAGRLNSSEISLFSVFSIAQRS